LRESGDTIQLYWLSGYIFFGSSENIFERIRADIIALYPRPVAYVILDFRLVPGADTSAVVSLGKLRRFCREKGVVLVCCSLSASNRAALERGGFFDRKNPQKVLPDFNSAIAWCEDQVLANTKLEVDVNADDFEAWLQRQFGNGSSEVMAYLERKDVDGVQEIYHQGDVADTLDLVAVGRLNIEVASTEGKRVGVRRVMAHTVVGEMGFFRHAVRSASVSSDGSAILFTLTRANFDRMRGERPDLAGAFAEFIVRIMAERIESANREIATLIR
jgi:SulP family sulfate permease